MVCNNIIFMTSTLFINIILFKSQDFLHLGLVSKVSYAVSIIKSLSNFVTCNKNILKCVVTVKSLLPLSMLVHFKHLIFFAI